MTPCSAGVRAGLLQERGSEQGRCCPHRPVPVGSIRLVQAQAPGPGPRGQAPSPPPPSPGPGGYLEGTLGVPGEYLEGTWRVPGEYLKGAWRVPGWWPQGRCPSPRAQAVP